VWLFLQARAAARSAAKEGERLGKAVEARDARIVTLVQDKQRLSEEADQRLSQVYSPATIHKDKGRGR